jgi:hypothetical protein
MLAMLLLAEEVLKALHVVLEEGIVELFHCVY